MEIEKLSKESIHYCNLIRGRNYKGCGSDYEFCKLCRENTFTANQLNNRTKKINDYAKKKYNSDNTPKRSK